MELMEDRKMLQRIISSQKEVIKNYEVIVSGYKEMIKVNKEKGQKLSDMIDMDISNKKSVLQALLLAHRKIVKLTDELKTYKDSSDIKNRQN